MSTRSLAVVLAALALPHLQAHAQGQRPAAAASPSPGAAALYGRGPLDGLAISMAFNRMNGTTPDFRPYAEASGPYKNATVFDKASVLTREISRIEGQFRTFDLDQAYSMRIGVQVMQYDAGRRGYQIGFGESSGIQMTDPVTYHTYRLAFRNAADVNFVQIGDPTAARNFSQQNGFDTQRDVAGQAALQIAFRLADAPPTLGSGGDTVRADILAARLVSQAGAVLYDFGNTSAANSSPTRSADGASDMPTLKAADTQGFRVGMMSAEAEALGSRGWQTKLGPQGSTTIALFNGLEQTSPRWAKCGTLEYGFPDPMAMFQGSLQAPKFTECVAVKLSAATAPGAPQTVTEVSAQQHLSTSDVGPLLAALRGKYGPPTYVRNDGSNLVWIGRDPAHPDSPSVQVMADVQQNGQGTSRETTLTVAIQPYVDPRPKPPPAPPTSTAPKL